MFNKSTAMTADEARTIAAATHKAFNETIGGRPAFNRVWDTDIAIQYFDDEATIPATAWQLGIFDTSDQAGVLGYHDYSSSGGPFGKAFVKTDIEVGASPSVTVSHEAFEQAGDPDLLRTYFIQLTANDATVYALEVCDPDEADIDAFVVTLDDGTEVLISNYIYPAWFDPGMLNVKGAHYDAQGKLTRPFLIAPLGYLTAWTPQAGWQQGTFPSGRHNPRVRRAVQPGSRLEKRRTPRDEWRISDPGTRLTGTPGQE